MYGVFVTREEVLDDDDGDWTFMATGCTISMVQPDWNYEYIGTEEECLRYAKEEYPYLTCDNEETGMIKAQVLYDAREREAQISGSDLHDLFRAVLDGEPSPAGATLIRISDLIDLMHATPDPDVARFIHDTINY